MKNTSLAVAAFCAVFIGSMSLAFAASFDLTNGGLGQAALNPQQFGVAVCDKSSDALTSAVPVTVTVGGQSATVSSVSPIAAGQCAYSYVSYSQLDMQPGQTYSVSVTVDPQHTVASNSNDEANYSVTVPGGAQASAKNTNLTADVAGQLSNPFSAAWNWIAGLFKGL